MSEREQVAAEMKRLFWSAYEVGPNGKRSPVLEAKKNARYSALRLRLVALNRGQR